MAAKHPIERNDYLILTRPIERVVKNVLRWLRYNFPGAMIYGQRRRGKSRCVRFIKKHLAQTLGFNIAVVVLCMRKHDIDREGDFLDDILDALGVAIGSRTAKGKKMELIRNRVLVLARRCPMHKVVLVIDDAQRMRRMHFDILMSIVNELEERYQVCLFTLLVGQPELKVRKDLMVAANQLQITGRLMADEIEFVGHRTAEELEFAWGRYGTHCVWPRKSGISYLAHYAPEAVKHGWTLAKEAPEIWAAYTQKREELNLEPTEEMSGQAMTAMAHFILEEYASKPGFRGLTPDQRDRVVLATGFLQIETMRSVNDNDNAPTLAEDEVD